MGFLERLFGMRPTPTPAAKAPEVEEEVVPVAEPVIEEEPAAEAAPVADTPAPVEEPPVEVTEPVVEAEAEPVAEDAPAAEAAPAEAVPVPAPVEESPFGPHLQRRLDTYFARLRQDFPDGVVQGLNTHHKKLAERGAELRRLIGYEGRLDDFFALGGFTYRRSVGGRPSLPAEQTASVEERLRAAFPEDVPTVLAVQQTDRRLYLDLRAAARRAGCTVGQYLEQFKA